MMKHWDSDIFEYGLFEDKILHVNSVENGLKCKCKCPVCREKLVAVNNIRSKKIRPHFRHYSNINCDFRAYQETVVHYLAKEIIEKKGYIIIPKTKISLSYDTKSYGCYIDTEDLPHINDLPNYLKKTSTNYNLQFDNIRIEKNEKNIRPDIIIILDKKKLYVEIAYSHFVDNEKLGKIKKHKLDAIEYDLSHLKNNSTELEIERALYSENRNVYWLNNEKINKTIKAKMKEALEIRDFIVENSKFKKTYANLKKVYNCPIHNSSKKTEFVSIEDVCKYCDYYFFLFENINTDKEQYEYEKRELEIQGLSSALLEKKYGSKIYYKEGNILCIGHLRKEIKELITVANTRLTQIGLIC